MEVSSPRSRCDRRLADGGSSWSTCQSVANPLNRYPENNNRQVVSLWPAEKNEGKTKEKLCQRCWHPAMVTRNKCGCERIGSLPGARRVVEI